jgi:hypothetical protein
MPTLATGTQLPTDISFNSGTMDINGTEMAVLQDITISLNWSTKEIRQLGSLLMAVAPKRTTFKPSAKAKAKSVNKELFSFFMGSSGTDGSGLAYNVLDGQNVLTRCSVKCIINEQLGQTVEFQFTNAILTGALTLGLKMEEPGESDFEIIAQNVTVVTSGNF